jgi:uronate dehydrogenase
VEGPWETILQANIIGCYNLFEAARRKGVKRVIFASSNHAVGFYPRTTKIGVDVTVRPDSRYGISKAFGEAVGAFYSDKHDLRVLCLRIGNVGDKPIDRRRLAIWISAEDLVQLIRIGFENPDLRFEIFYGASFNERAWWDNSRAYDYGYRPTGVAENYREEALAAQAKAAPDPVGDFFQGGTFCSAEFDGDHSRASGSRAEFALWRRDLSALTDLGRPRTQKGQPTRLALEQNEPVDQALLDRRDVAARRG